MNKPPIKIGSLVQLNPETVGRAEFAGCIMVVTDLKAWGVVGYIKPPGKDGSHIFYRAQWNEMERVGVVKWMTY